MVEALQDLCEQMGCEPGINRADFLRDRFTKYRSVLERHHTSQLARKRSQADAYRVSQLCLDTVTLIGEQQNG